MTAVASAEEVRRSKRETGYADSDSYEEYKSDEDNVQGGRGVEAEEDATKNEVKIISVRKEEKVVDGVTAKKETGDKKKEKKKKERHSKHAHDEEGGEILGGQEKKERKKEKKSKEGKKEKKSKEQKAEEKAAKAKTEKALEEKKEVKNEEVPQKEQSETVEQPKESAEEETKPSEALAAKPQEVQHEAAPPPAAAPVRAIHVESVTDTIATAATAAAPDSTVVVTVAAHPVPITSEVPVPEPVKDKKSKKGKAPTPAVSIESPAPKKAEEKAAPPVAPTEAAPPSEAPMLEKARDYAVPLEAAPPEAAPVKPILSETAPLPAQEPSREPIKDQPAAEETPVTVTESSVAKSHTPEPSQPSFSIAVTTDLQSPGLSDASGQVKASAKVEELQAGPQPPRGVAQILERARKEAAESAAGSSRLLMARSLVARQEKLQEQLTNIRHEFGDIDSEIRALKIDCYRNQRAFAKHH